MLPLLTFRDGFFYYNDTRCGSLVNLIKIENDEVHSLVCISNKGEDLLFAILSATLIHGGLLFENELCLIGPVRRGSSRCEVITRMVAPRIETPENIINQFRRSERARKLINDNVSNRGVTVISYKDAWISIDINIAIRTERDVEILDEGLATFDIDNYYAFLAMIDFITEKGIERLPNNVNLSDKKNLVKIH